MKRILRFGMGSKIVIFTFVCTGFLSVGQANAAVDNLFANSSVENASGTKPQSWSSDKWGTTQAAFTYPTGSAPDGDRYVKTEVTKKGTGDAKWYPAHIPATSGTTYVFSDWYQSNVGSFVEVEYLMTDNSYQYVRLGTLDASADWKQFGATFVVPANVQSMTIFHFIQAVGTLSVDNYSLTAEDSLPLPDGNIVPNGSFEKGTTRLPTSWQHDKWGNNKTVFTYNKNIGHTGTHSVTLTVSAYKKGDAKWDLVTPLAVTPGDTYDFSDWYQSTTVSHVVIEFDLTDGTQYYIEMRTAPISSGWAKYDQSFQVPYNATSMRVFHMLESNGTLTIDDVSLVKTTPRGFSRPLVTLTFDNGFEDNINTAIPMMNAAGIPATYCISTQYVEGIPAQENIVKQIAAEGYEICSHAVHHDNGDMTQETVTQIDDELSQSQSYLQTLVNQPIHNFLTPFGAYNDTVINEIKKYYRAHRTTDEGYNTVENFDQYRLLVQNMEPGTTLAQLQSWLSETKKTNSWLILVYHRVATSSLTAYDTPLQDFQPQLDALNASGITVKTFDQALDEVIPQINP